VEATAAVSSTYTLVTDLQSPVDCLSSLAARSVCLFNR